MPRNSSVAATAFPRTAPLAVATTRPPRSAELAPVALVLLVPELRLGLEVGLGVAVALVHAATVISTAAAAAPIASPVRTRCLADIACIAASASSRPEQSD